jgi:hypothetical protein
MKLKDQLGLSSGCRVIWRNSIGSTRNQGATKQRARMLPATRSFGRQFWTGYTRRRVAQVFHSMGDTYQDENKNGHISRIRNPRMCASIFAY